MDNMILLLQIDLGVVDFAIAVAAYLDFMFFFAIAM